MSKIRRVDFYPDEYIAGVAGVMTAEQQGVYWIICSLIFSQGGQIENDPKQIGRLVCLGPSKAKRIINELIFSGKLIENGTKIAQKRAEKEMEKAQKRIEIATKNGSVSKKNKHLAEAPAFSPAKLTTNQEPATKKDSVSTKQGESPGAGVVSLDLKTQIFGPVLKWLTISGTPERQARSILGKWSKEYGDQAILDCSIAGAKEAPHDPVSWMTAALKSRSGSGGGLSIHGEEYRGLI